MFLYNYLFAPTVCEILEGRGSDVFRSVNEHLAWLLAYTSSCLISSGKEDRKNEREGCVATHLNTAARQRPTITVSGYETIDHD